MTTRQPIQARTQADTHLDQPSQQFRYGWIKAEEAVAYLDLGSESALYRLIREHRLPCGRAGRRYRFRRVDLDAWMTEHRAVTREMRRA